MMQKESGSITIEALLLVPALFLFSSLIIYVGRMTDAALSVRRAADVAARVASESNAQTSKYQALQVARRELSLLKSGCDHSDVDVVSAIRNAAVTYEVRVTCIVNSRGLGLLALAPRSVTAESTEIVDFYTSR
jgi:Flp pilus assembly protein TadG